MSKHEELVRLVDMMRMHARLWTSEWSKNNPLEISQSQAITLDVLNTEGPKPSTYLSQLVGVTSGGMTVISDKLVRQNLVRRVNDANDRRVVKLEITDEGRKAMKQIRIKQEALIDKLFDPLDPEEIALMTAIYRKLLDQTPKENE
ncbi:MarR family winged helix-turn-helix transcriptional regulator [Cohnella nanjingensis]|uniref:MarR family transcriptional regulator n=1 Tax=Cohnella nanjingensis TaxID=1387779 RepID=A0A7X0RLV2_9BACL|nr:MarR family transcriptional regulator [Cohnella nanjingensis]MBB6669888.1 MarR family transcriptional regulator [Cohnella nanjingensis]